MFLWKSSSSLKTGNHSLGLKKKKREKYSEGFCTKIKKDRLSHRCQCFTNSSSIRETGSSVHLLFLQVITQIKPCHQLDCCPGFKVWFVTWTIPVWTIQRLERLRVKSTTLTTPCKQCFSPLHSSHRNESEYTIISRYVCLDHAVFMMFLCHVRISGMLIELQTLLVDRSIISKAQRLADDIDQWNSLLQYNPDVGKRTTQISINSDIRGVQMWVPSNRCNNRMEKRETCYGKQALIKKNTLLHLH